ncbi:UvrD-helicase domain-containing protein [Nocardioides sp.]|uniref:UvrD-helicase domain-containing protein n=2 Tax=unclassified Nocardioides TaxID=2615069 RepID=UPI001996C7B2|nr:UvrD-helicase domain-containing protein [Nocardioides sp.]MBC7278678.1 UvrD-helicase domain-containing protein [Nocardioides sp.]
MGVRLTDRQVIAAATDDRLVNIVSAPGSGKTTVATARFGYLHHGAPDGRRGVLALSFNRAAVGELRSRIAARWGRQALAFPNLVTTFDDFHERMLKHLLRLGLIKWPEGHLHLDVIDDYSSLSGYRSISAGGWLRVASSKPDGTVFSDCIRSPKATFGLTQAEPHRAVLAAGKVSHDDVRVILRVALQRPEFQVAVDAWMAENFRSVVVDEIYDADELDLHVVSQAASLGLAVTVVGDPWQALYGWRGSTPEKVQSNLLDQHDFRNFDQPESFRFKTDQTRELAGQLRGGESVNVPSIASDEVDVALARQWKHLWPAGENILPLAFRSGASSDTDALLCLLLDVVTSASLGLQAFSRQNALIRLGISEDDLENFRDAVLRPALEELVANLPAADVLENLRARVGTFGRRRPRRGQADGLREEELDLLRTRLQRGDLIAGLTVHQAKGREWDRVGVVLTRAQERELHVGLRELEPEHCVLYVALTRAKYASGSLHSLGELDLTEEA